MNFSFESFVDGNFDYDRVTKTHSCIWLREEKMDIGGGKITTAQGFISAFKWALPKICHRAGYGYCFVNVNGCFAQAPQGGQHHICTTGKQGEQENAALEAMVAASHGVVGLIN